MSNLLSRLNGWQRLWFVFTIICFILTTIFVVVGQRKTNAVEDEAIITKLNADEVKKFRITFLSSSDTSHKEPWTKYQAQEKIFVKEMNPFDQFVGRSNSKKTANEFDPDAYLQKLRLAVIDTVEFPNDMSNNDVQDFIRKYDNLDTIRIRAAGLIVERNRKQVTQARNENNKGRQSNVRLILYGYVAWLSFVVSIYLLGYGIGWIYHGFKKS
ncbi:MAG TPA: hypothetical protein VIS48_06885 [Candidatus Kryptonia bacterium]